MTSASARAADRRRTYPRSSVFCSVLLFISFALSAAVGPGLRAQGSALLPSIGLSSVPEDADTICTIPIVAGHNRGYRDAGPMLGDPVPDFTLYDPDGNAFTLSEALRSGKPVLLINGSYTCPVFREKMTLINEVMGDYGDKLVVALIYTLEAHPLADTSVYYGYVNTSKPNYDDGVLYRQPRTYGERKRVAADMLAALQVDAPVYIDGPCNEWWNVFGPAPNNAFLIDTAGRVFAKHGWFHRNPDNIRFDIARLFGEDLPQLDSAGGFFQFTLQSPSIVVGPVNETLYATAELWNNSDAPVEIGIGRQPVSVPEGWSTALCTDICLDTGTTTTSLMLEPGGKQLFTLYIYSGSTPDTARVTVMFRNLTNPQNRYMQSFTGITEPVTSDIEGKENEPDLSSAILSVFPNPASGRAIVSAGLSKPARVRLELFGPLGRHIASLCDGQELEAGIHTFDLPPLPSGNYFLRLVANGTEKFAPVRISE